MKKGRISKDEKGLISALFDQGKTLSEIAGFLDRKEEAIIKALNNKLDSASVVTMQEAIINAAQTSTTSATPTTHQTLEDQFMVNKTYEKKRRPVTSKENSFEDDGKAYAEDTVLQRKLSVVAPVERRLAAKKVESQCRNCDNFEMVDAVFVSSGNHTCEKCLKGLVGQ